MHWDQETYMPSKGATFRAQQMSTLSGIAHELGTDPKIGKWLEELKADTSLGAKEARTAELIRKKFEREQKYPVEFVTEHSKAVSEAYQAWEAARKADDFSVYVPSLTHLIELKRRQTEIVGFEDHPYAFWLVSTGAVATTFLIFRGGLAYLRLRRIFW